MNKLTSDIDHLRPFAKALMTWCLSITTLVNVCSSTTPIVLTLASYGFPNCNFLISCKTITLPYSTEYLMDNSSNAKNITTWSSMRELVDLFCHRNMIRDCLLTKKTLLDGRDESTSRVTVGGCNFLLGLSMTFVSEPSPWEFPPAFSPVFSPCFPLLFPLVFSPAFPPVFFPAFPPDQF